MKVQTGCWDCPGERGQAAAGRKIPMNMKEWQLKPPRREKDYSRKVPVNENGSWNPQGKRKKITAEPGWNGDYIKKGLTPYLREFWSHACMYSNIHYRHLRRQCRVVNELESQETNKIYLFIRIKVLNPHPALQATSKSLEILLPAAVDLLFHRNETGASLTTGLEYGM